MLNVALSEKQRNLLKVIISGLSLLLCMFAAFYFLVVWDTGFVYTHFFYVPVVLVSVWWRRKGVILTFALALFTVICNLFLAPNVSIVNELVRAPMLMFIGILTSAIFEQKQRIEDKLRNLAKFPSENPNPVLRVAKDGTVLYANPATKSQLSELKAEVGKTAQPQLRRLVADALNSGVRKDGEVDHRNRTFLFTLAPVTEATYVNAYGLDITERKQAEEALRESKERYMNLFENARDAIVTFDLKGNVTAVNKAAVEYGFKIDDVVGKNMLKFVSKKYWPKLIRDLARISRGNMAKDEIELVTPRGKIFVEYQANPIIHDSKVVGVQAILRNVTERKQAEERIRASEESYRSLVELAPDGIISFDMKGVITSCNTAAANLSGYSKDEIVGKYFSKIGPIQAGGFPKYLKMLFSIARGKVPEPFEVVYRRKDGTLGFGEVRTSLLRKEGKTIGAQAIIRDITERKQAEEQVKQLQEHLQLQINRMPIGLIVWDTEFRAKTWNPAATGIFGFLEKEALGKHPYDFIVPKQAQPHVDEIWSRLLKGDETAHSVNENVTKDGRTITCAWANTPLKKDDGTVIGVLSMIQDITEHKQMENTLRESEEKWRSLVKNAPNIIIIVDRDGKIQFINRTVIDASPEEVIGRSVYDFINLEHQDVVRKTIRQVFQTGEGGSYEISGTGSDGGTSWYATQVGPIKRDGQIVSVTLITVDVTERKQMEEKLKQYSEQLEELVQKKTNELSESEKKYSVLVEEASDGVAILQDGKIVFTNKKGTEITDYSQDELIGLPFEKLVSEEYKQLTKERYERRLRGENIPSTYEIEIISKTGNQVPVELSATRIQYQGCPADLLLVRDTSERKRVEEQHSKLERLAAIGEIAGMVGHDLRNPLQGIKSAAYYLNKNRTSCSDDDRKKMLMVIDRAVAHADKIINDLQEYSKEIQLDRAKFSPHALLAEALSLIQVPARVKVIDDTLEEPEVRVDKAKMVRAFINLIKNAVDAMPEGGTLQVKSTQANGNVEISFSDTGIGMSEETLEKLFTPLMTTKAQGMGLGLAICKRIVEAHQGKISVQSVEGKGSTFTLTIPIEPELKDGGEKAWQVLSESSLSMTTRT
jgi:PAS domain S-box-containing protein